LSCSPALRHHLIPRPFARPRCKSRRQRRGRFVPRISRGGHDQ
jgi:hypothetical protein